MHRRTSEYGRKLRTAARQVAGRCDEDTAAPGFGSDVSAASRTSALRFRELVGEGMVSTVVQGGGGYIVTTTAEGNG